MRAALYARYSTDEQNVASTEDQLRGCRILCERNGFEIVDEYSDPAMSGHESNRPQYRKMIAAAKARGFDVVVAHELSRLSRNEAETHTLREELGMAARAHRDGDRRYQYPHCRHGNTVLRASRDGEDGGSIPNRCVTDYSGPVSE